MLFPIAITQKDNTFFGHLPDLPELEITGDSMADTIANARYDVIRHLQQFAENDKPMPEGSDIATHLIKPEFAGWTWAIVSIDANRIVGENVDVTLSVSERLMQKIQQHVAKENIDVETFFINLAKDALE